MEELRALEARLEQALSVLEQSEGVGAGGDDASAGRIAELEAENLSLIHISEPTRLESKSRFPSCA